MDQDVTDVDVSEETDHALSEGLLSAGKYNLHALHGKRHILVRHVAKRTSLLSIKTFSSETPR